MTNPPPATQAQTPNLRNIHLSPPGDFFSWGPDNCPVFCSDPRAGNREAGLSARLPEEWGRGPTAVPHPPPSPPLGDVGALRPTPVTCGWRERFPWFLLSTRPRSCKLQFCCPTYFLGAQRPHQRERTAVHGASPRDELTEGTRLTRQVCKKSRTFSPSAAFSHLLRSEADSSGRRASRGHFIGGEVRKENTVCARAPSFLIR